MVKNRHDQIIIFHKSKLLLLYYTISFLVIRVGSALIMFREAGLRELEMTTGGSDDGDPPIAKDSVSSSFSFADQCVE